MLSWGETFAAEFGRPMRPDDAWFDSVRHVPVGVLPVIAWSAQEASERWADCDAFDVQWLLLRTVDRWARDGLLTEAQMEAWIALLAGAATWRAAGVLRGTLCAFEHGFAGALAGWTGLPGRTGALGWAAGLTPQETAGRNVGDLQAMAALRGWTLGALLRA